MIEKFPPLVDNLRKLCPRKPSLNWDKIFATAKYGSPGICQDDGVEQ
jgi:hypothetical protein